MKTVEMKTTELIGRVLDFAVAKAVRVQVDVVPSGIISDASTGHKPRGRAYRIWVSSDVEPQEYSPSTDWSQGGPLIEKYKLTIQQVNGIAATFADDTGEPDYDGRTMRIADGVTVLIAACRAIVAAKLGDTFSVPAELVGGDV